MGFFSKIFGRKTDEEQQKAGGMEDFMTLIRVYFQAVMAADLGITNLAALPDLRVFKATLHVPTQNNKLGLAEKSRCKEIEQSIRKRCKKPQDIQTYMIQFSAFSQDLMMLTGNLMKFKLRLPGFFKSAIYTMTEKTVNDIFNKNDFSDAGVMKTVVAIRQYDQKLGFTQQWVTHFVYKIVMLAKKEKRPAEADSK